MSWTALIPLKGSGERKTRLAGRLSPEERQTLSKRMFDHVRGVLAACSEIGEIALLSDMRVHGWRGPFFKDAGRGLNAELGAAATALGPRPLLAIHADLPRLDPADIAALIAEATEAGCAIAPDRLGSGTNAIALLDPTGFAFAFGPGSFALHRKAAGVRARIVRRPGLALDIDTPEDLDACGDVWAP